MPYVVPTPAQFKIRFPAFAAVADATVQALLTEAARNVDESWFEKDYQPAIMYLAAHYLKLEGVLGDDVNVTGPITSERLGDASVTYANAQTGVMMTQYGTTLYGRRYYELLRVNQPAVELT